MNQNDCGSHEKVTKKEKFIHKYQEFDYQMGADIRNEFRFIHILFQISKYVIKN